MLLKVSTCVWVEYCFLRQSIGSGGDVVGTESEIDRCSCC